MKLQFLCQDDAEILASLKAGDVAALDKLYLDHTGDLLSYLLRKGIPSEEAADMIQDLFFQLWINREQLDLRKDFRSYLTWKLRNKMIDQYHHRLVEQAYRQEAMMKVAYTADVEEHCNYRELQVALENGIVVLPSKMQEIFRLRKLQGKSVKEIAYEMDISEQTVKNQITTALRKLRISLSEFLSLITFLSLLKIFFNYL